MVLVIEFLATDARFTGKNTVYFNFYPGSDHTSPGTGTFRIQPYTNPVGYWEGSLATVLKDGGAAGWHTQFHAMGHCSLEGLVLEAVNESGRIHGVIIELPHP